MVHFVAACITSSMILTLVSGAPDPRQIRHIIASLPYISKNSNTNPPPRPPNPTVTNDNVGASTVTPDAGSTTTHEPEFGAIHIKDGQVHIPSAIEPYVTRHTMSNGSQRIEISKDASIDKKLETGVLRDSLTGEVDRISTVEPGQTVVIIVSGSGSNVRVVKEKPVGRTGVNLDSGESDRSRFGDEDSIDGDIHVDPFGGDYSSRNEDGHGVVDIDDAKTGEHIATVDVTDLADNDDEDDVDAGDNDDGFDAFDGEHDGNLPDGGGVIDNDDRDEETVDIDDAKTGEHIATVDLGSPSGDIVENGHEEHGHRSGPPGVNGPSISGTIDFKGPMKPAHSGDTSSLGSGAGFPASGSHVGGAGAGSNVGQGGLGQPGFGSGAPDCVGDIVCQFGKEYKPWLSGNRPPISELGASLLGQSGRQYGGIVGVPRFGTGFNIPRPGSNGQFGNAFQPGRLQPNGGIGSFGRTGFNLGRFTNQGGFVPGAQTAGFRYPEVQVFPSNFPNSGRGQEIGNAGGLRQNNDFRLGQPQNSGPYLHQVQFGLPSGWNTRGGSFRAFNRGRPEFGGFGQGGLVGFPETHGSSSGAPFSNPAGLASQGVSRGGPFGGIQAGRVAVGNPGASRGSFNPGSAQPFSDPGLFGASAHTRPGNFDGIFGGRPAFSGQTAPTGSQSGGNLALYHQRGPFSGLAFGSSAGVGDPTAFGPAGEPFGGFGDRRIGTFDPTGFGQASVPHHSARPVHTSKGSQVRVTFGGRNNK